MGGQTSKPEALIIVLYPDLQLYDETLRTIQDIFGHGNIPDLGCPAAVSEDQTKLKVKIGIAWNVILGRCLTRSILMENYPSTEVVVCFLCTRRIKAYHDFCLDILRESLSDPRLCDVTVLVVISDKPEQYSEDKDTRTLNVDELKKLLVDKAVFLPSQELHIIESNTGGKKILDLAINIAGSRSVVKKKFADQNKVTKVKNKFIDLCRSALQY